MGVCCVFDCSIFHVCYVKIYKKVICMDFAKIINKFHKLKEERDKNTELTEEADDKVLTSLRRQYNLRQNEMEKQYLKNYIKKYEKDKFNKNMGWTKPASKKFNSKFNKRDSLLHDKRPLLKEKRNKIRNMFI